MQVWDAKNKGYIFQDKYYGRDLRVGKDFQNALTRYLTSTAGGQEHVLTYHIPTILSKIQQLGTPPLPTSAAPNSCLFDYPLCFLYTCFLWLVDFETDDDRIHHPHEPTVPPLRDFAAVPVRRRHAGRN